MNPSKSLLTVSVLLVTLLTLFSAHDPASAVATELEPLSAHPSAPCTASAASGVGIDPLPPMAPGVVLVGLNPGVAIRTSDLGVQASDASLSATFADAGVQDVEPVFPGARAPPGVASTGGAVDLISVYRLRLAAGADVLQTAEVLRGQPGDSLRRAGVPGAPHRHAERPTLCRAVGTGSDQRARGLGRGHRHGGCGDRCG